MSRPVDSFGSVRPGRPLPRLSSPVDQLSGHVEVAVIGSGYGGAITASRLARAKRQVWILERGRELHPGEFPDTLPEATAEAQLHHGSGHVGSRTALYDMHALGDMNVFVGCGLGGTSLINANVALRADPRVFQRSCWPAELVADAFRLERCYVRAEAMLAPQRLPDRGIALAKVSALEASARELPGSRFSHPPINVTFDEQANAAGIHQPGCNFCGDCVAGCNVGSKNTVLMNYLPDAVGHGAKIFTEVSVHHLSRVQGRWHLHCELLHTGQELFHAPMVTITADVVVLSAGTLGSTEILLRSRNDVSLPDTVGTRFSGNGDVLAFSYNGDRHINGMGWGSHHPNEAAAVGPCIAGIIDLRDGELDQGMVIEEGAIPGGLAAYLPVLFGLSGAAIGVDTQPGVGDEIAEHLRELETLVGGPHVGALRNTLTYLVMAHDGSDGRLELDADDRLEVQWPGVGDKPIFTSISDNLLRATKAHHGTYVKDPLWSRHLGNRLITVHPLGGCPMGADASTAVVNHKGQVFKGISGTDVHESLYVSDGAVIPCSLGVNPLLTISALAERTAAILAEDRGWTVDYDSPTPEIPQQPKTVGIRFTERMAGWAASGAVIPADYRRAAEAGRTANHAVSFVLTITTDDLDGFLRDPDHLARMAGTVTAPALSAEPMPTCGGTFNLFIRDPDDAGLVHMQYRTRLRTIDGRNFFLSGHKNMGQDRLRDLWSATTTLFTEIHEGDDDSGAVVARGVLTIKPVDFAQQLRSMRATGTSSIREQLDAQARFGTAFASELFGVYGPVATRRVRLVDDDAAPRKKRPLRAPAPELYPFTTDDGVELLLTRYRGGTKGPVMLAHGLGVSSLIFTIDTIGTNLVEYLCANGYDVWLADLRASIALPASRTQYSADDIAEHDYPAAVEKVRQVTGAASIQVVAHCFGSTTFICAMLAGLQGVRAAVCSQVATHMVVPSLTSIKSGLHVPDVLNRFGLHTLSAEAHSKERWLERAFDQGLEFWPMRHEEKCDSGVCHRISFLYALLYNHDQLNSVTHDAALAEMFGVASITAFQHLAAMVRHGTVVGADGSDRYLPHLDRLALPLTIIHGAENACFLPESTAKTVAALAKTNGPEWYRRHVIPGYGHIDCIFGAQAATDVYPLIVQGLQPTATL